MLLLQQVIHRGNFLTLFFSAQTIKNFIAQHAQAEMTKVVDEKKMLLLFLEMFKTLLRDHCSTIM